MITSDLIRALNPRLTPERAAAIAEGLQVAAQQAGITTLPRVAAFLAQLAHESGAFRYSEELWGPTPAQRRYEGRVDLGNAQPGDGYRYRGRGWIQLTGRHNYRKFGARLGVPLEAEPDLAARPDVAARIAAAYWTDRGLNALADAGNFELITRRINGGLNGYPDRLRYLARITDHLRAQVRPRLLLVPKDNSAPAEWNGRDNPYGGVTLSDALAEQLRVIYPAGTGPHEYQGLRVWHRRNGDLVLERGTPAIPALPPKK